MSPLIGQTDEPLDSLQKELFGMSEHVDALAQFISHCNTTITIAS